MYAILPQRLVAGESATLSALAVDVDSNNLSFSWSAPTGIIGDASSANTTFACTEPGSVTLTLTVSDDGCSDVVELDVRCDG